MTTALEMRSFSAHNERLNDKVRTEALDSQVCCPLVGSWHDALLGLTSPSQKASAPLCYRLVVGIACRIYDSANRQRF
ncbi:MAG: hypothetical protein F6K09_27120 [Merismopedia sp. SIO2A8]|nr:hypothetical protein [Merismopedia sp. SIO2A8]